ncbi:Mut/nudix family protein [Halorubrum coriense DSM 10284]|uniref:Mut/nudix family protein n=1 Tax=Halorubrum coriense DSM 10284 TaxID=1227466 RepID=M0EEQ7_9EURY|nr:Mut/nudix family protein [Halorubrum coriense DSM 10284]
MSVRGVILDTRGRVLIVKRATDHEWELPGGRLSRDEPPQQGLHREVREETALSVEIEDVVKANSWVNTAGDGRFAVHYRCYTKTQTVELSPEHVDSAWILPERTTEQLCEPQAAAVMAATTTEANTDSSSGSSVAQD